MYFFKKKDLYDCMKGDKKFIKTEKNDSYSEPNNFNEAWNVHSNAYAEDDCDEVKSEDIIHNGNKYGLFIALNRMKHYLEKSMEDEIKKETLRSQKLVKEKYEKKLQCFENECKRLESEMFLKEYKENPDCKSSMKWIRML